MLCVSLALCCATHASQDGKLPLHYAAVKGASYEVTELLLDANRDAAAKADKARSSAHTVPPTLPRQIYVPSFSLFFSHKRAAPPDQCCAARLLYAGRKAAPALRCRQGRTARCDEAAARGQP